MLSHIDQWLYGNALHNISAQELAQQIQDYSLKMYRAANEHSQEK